MLTLAMGAGYEQHFGLRERAFEPVGSDAPAYLDAEAVEPYLVERLRGAGWQGAPVLDLGLAPLLFEATSGDRAAIDRAMTALLEDAARDGRDVIEGDSLVSWLDDENVEEARPAGLAEAQIVAIEGAFAEHDRALARLRRELAELREGATARTDAPEAVEDRLASLEARLDQQDAALRHVLERLIGFFEREGPARR